MRVAVLAPMPSELRPVVAELGLRRGGGRDGTPLEGAVGDVQVVVAMTGIGPDLATEATERLLAAHRVDHLLVSGIAGGLDGVSDVGDLVVPAEAIDSADGTRFAAAPVAGVALAGAVRTGGVDSYRLAPEELVQLASEGVVGLDMETAAVARVCRQHGVPWTAFRGISDMAGDESVGEEVMTLVRPDGSPDVPAAARFFLRNPRRLPRMIRLGRDAGVAAKLAARATRAAVEALGREPAGT